MRQGSILKKLRDAHTAQSGKRPLNFGVYYKNTLVALCHALEDAILEGDYQPLMLTAFQQGKWYLQEAERYGQLAERSPQIVILATSEAGFSEHLTSQRSNVALVHLNPEDPVAQEWHLVIVSPNYTAMVLCQELSEIEYGAKGLPSTDLERKFYGLWTFEPALVQEAAELLIAQVGHYNPELQVDLTYQLQTLVAQCQNESALCGAPTAEHLGQVVSRVVDYLQTHQQDLAIADPLDNNLTSNELQAFLRMAQLLDQMDLTTPMTSANVATLAEAMGQLLDLPAWQLHRLRLAGLLHRVAFLPTVETVLTATPSVTTQAIYPDTPPSCPLIPGVQVLRKMQQIKAIATILAHQTEWWNGSGQPAGLSGDAIPIESRILALVTDFQQQVVARSQETESPELALEAAMAACRSKAGDRYDPKLIETLELLVLSLKQGFSLPVTLPKIAGGLWLVDSHSAEELITFDDAASLNEL